MNENNASLWGEHHAEPTNTDYFLWWLSATEPELLQHCTVDRNRYRITGLVVLCTWLFATLAWTYFFSTTLASAWAYIPLGLFMGFIILTIDRALIKGINKQNKRKIGPLLFRGVLALTIGFFMAQPAVLYMFNKEITMQAGIDNQAKVQQMRTKLDSMYAPQKNSLEQYTTQSQLLLTNKYNEVEKARTNFLAEIDGSGGSGKVGISTIAHAKKAEYEALQKEYDGLAAQTKVQVDSLQRHMAKVDSALAKDEADFKALLNTGFLTRIEALQHLIEANSAVAFRYYLIIAILMLIELMPVIVKSMLPSGPYEEALLLTEQAEQRQLQKRIGHSTLMNDYYYEKIAQEDKQLMDEFFTEHQPFRRKKMMDMSKVWSTENSGSFYGLWQRIKSGIFSR